ncbi:MAG TPA: GNAT family N-acetyltransferase [Polyangiaceae bacterium]|nr:GNAT family N-acetyltransferase [Polyangiaceae bacterium]
MSTRTLPELTTARLRLRQWRTTDLEPFARMNRDPLVMEYFPSLQSREQSDAIVARTEQLFRERGFGLWALELPGVAEFAGFVGLSVPRFEAHFTPCVEVGWRLTREHWGHGYATEAAQAALEFGFDACGLAEIVSMAVATNQRSRRVMERLGMARDADDDFDHPSLPEGHPLRRHVLYRQAAPRP